MKSGAVKSGMDFSLTQGPRIVYVNDICVTVIELGKIGNRSCYGQLEEEERQDEEARSIHGARIESNWPPESKSRPFIASLGN